MSSKSKTKRNSPKASGKTKGIVNEKKSAVKSERKSSNGLDFGATMQNAIKEEDVERIVSVQNRSLKSFVKTNELLGKFNDFSSSKYDVLQHMFVQHTRLLVELKKDLTSIFLRIRRLKGKLKKQHPDAFEATFNLRQDLEDRLEQETPDEPTYAVNSKEHNKGSKIKDEGRSKSERGQVESTNLNTNTKSEKGDTAKDTTAVRSDKRATEGDEEHVGTIGTSGSEELVAESTETVRNIEVVPQHQLSLENVEDAWLMVQKLDPGVALGKAGLKEVEVLNGAGQSLGGISGSLEDADDSHKTMEKNKNSQERAGDDTDEASRGLKDAEDRAMGNDDLKDTKDNLEGTGEDPEEDNLETADFKDTKGNLEEKRDDLQDNLKETDEDLEDTKDSQGSAGDNVDEGSWYLKDAEDRAMGNDDLKDTKDNLEGTGEDPEEGNLETADFKDTKGNLEEKRDLKETDEDLEDTKDNLEGTREDLIETEDNLEGIGP